MSLIFRMVTRSAGIDPSLIKWNALDTKGEEDLRHECLGETDCWGITPPWIPRAVGHRFRESSNQWPAWVGIRTFRIQSNGAASATPLSASAGADT